MDVERGNRRRPRELGQPLRGQEHALLRRAALPARTDAALRHAAVRWRRSKQEQMPRRHPDEQPRRLASAASAPSTGKYAPTRSQRPRRERASVGRKGHEAVREHQGRRPDRGVRRGLCGGDAQSGRVRRDGRRCGGCWEMVSASKGYGEKSGLSGGRC